MKASIRGYLLESLGVSSALQKTTHSYSILLYYTKSLEFGYLTIIIPLLCHIHDAVQTACSPSHVTAVHAETYAGVLAAFHMILSVSQTIFVRWALQLILHINIMEKALCC